MNSIEVLQEFSRIDEKCRKVSGYIVKQNPMQYEEEYGTGLIKWSDQNLMDLFINKMHFYKMFSLGNVMSKYHVFYNYCSSRGYITHNPFDRSMYLSYDYLIRAAAEAGNVPFYTKDHIRKECAGQGENAPYLLAAAFAIYEGIRDYKSLCEIRAADVDFEKCTIRGYESIPFSKELMKALAMVKGDEFLIPAAVTDRKADVHVCNRQRILSNKMQKTGLKQTGLHDSGIIQRLCEKIGQEQLLASMFYDESTDKIFKIQNNKKLKSVFEELGIEMSVKNFVYDYRVYGLCLKYKLWQSES